MAEIFGFDAFSPREIAERVANVGVAKARLALLPMVMLSLLAGAFIGLGALYFVLISSDAGISFAISRVLGGVAFSLGLLLVIVAGAELFTGNNLLAMAWADGRISTAELLRNWIIVCCGNFAGAVGLAMLVFLSHHGDMNNGLIAQQYVKIAAAKCALPPAVAFFRAVLCNVLVCMAVWMAMAGRSVADKAVAIVFPISAFVAAGFEHSIANMYLIPLALMFKAGGVLPGAAEALSIPAMFGNLGIVIAGNLFGGSILVALVYYLIYRRGMKAPQ